MSVWSTRSPHTHTHTRPYAYSSEAREHQSSSIMQCCVMPLRPGLTLKLDISRFDPAHATSYSSATSSVYMGASDLNSGPRACVTNALTCRDIF